MAKLKVFVVPTGFHDAYVAAPSRKAALAAWGSTHDLFARGVATEVTDPVLMAEPLAHPGDVIKRSRGTAAEQIAALPPDAKRKAPRDAHAEAGAGRATVRAKAKVGLAKLRPRPSRRALDVAEALLAEAKSKHRAEDAALANRQSALERERRALNEAHGRKQQDLEDALRTERNSYEAALERWRDG